MKFMDLPRAKKGALGESIVDVLIRSHGNWIPYKPTADCAHPFDRLVAGGDKSTIFITDVKAKPRRKYYPDTGINVSAYNTYQAISQKHRLKVFLFFVDENEGQIYGEFIHILDRPAIICHGGKTLRYPLVQNGIRYWPRASMRSFGALTKEQIEDLKNLSTQNSAYEAEAA